MQTWERTRLQNLVRHKSGRYYGRAFAGGKEVWKSLKTSHFSVARAKLAAFLKEHRERVSNSSDGVSATMTFGEAAAIRLRNLDDNLRIKRIKPRTRDYWGECLEWNGGKGGISNRRFCVPEYSSTVYSTAEQNSAAKLRNDM